MYLPLSDHREVDCWTGDIPSLFTSCSQFVKCFALIGVDVAMSRKHVEPIMDMAM